MGVLMIDTEGFDCALVQSLDLCDGALRPAVLIFEHIHCKDQRAAAMQSLIDAPARCGGGFAVAQTVTTVQNTLVVFAPAASSVPSRRGLLSWLG